MLDEETGELIERRLEPGAPHIRVFCECVGEGRDGGG